MIKDIEEFYNKTKMKKISIVSKGKTPIEYIHVFHKEYPRFPSVKLPKESDSGEYNKLLRLRRSKRTFSNKPVSVKIIAKILSACRIIKTSPERRTYPSGGARFPVELYLVASKINGLKSGIYHFNFNRFSLEVLSESQLKKDEIESISVYLKNVAGAIILTTVISRSEVKYGLKAYPFSLIEAGHMGQNILLSCTKYKIGSFPIGGFVNDNISELLDLTEDELPIYVIGFGSITR
jgi:SagB-type dehydrogenase family enzyme